MSSPSLPIAAIGTGLFLGFLAIWTGCPDPAPQPSEVELEDELEDDDPFEACQDICGVMARRAVDCERLPFEVAQAGFERLLTGGRGCSSIRSVRDATALYQRCLPAVLVLPCSDIRSSRWPAACLNQLR